MKFTKGDLAVVRSDALDDLLREGIPYDAAKDLLGKTIIIDKVFSDSEFDYRIKYAPTVDSLPFPYWCVCEHELCANEYPDVVTEEFKSLLL